VLSTAIFIIQETRGFILTNGHYCEGPNVSHQLLNEQNVIDAKEWCQRNSSCIGIYDRCGQGKIFNYCTKENKISSSCCGSILYTKDDSICQLKVVYLEAKIANLEDEIKKLIESEKIAYQAKFANLESKIANLDKLARRTGESLVEICATIEDDQFHCCANPEENKLYCATKSVAEILEINTSNGSGICDISKTSSVCADEDD